MVVTADGVKLTRTESRLKEGAASASLNGDACLDLSENPPPANEVECRSIEEVLGRSAVSAK